MTPSNSRWTDPEFDDSPAAIAARLATRRAAIRKAYYTDPDGYDDEVLPLDRDTPA